MPKKAKKSGAKKKKASGAEAETAKKEFRSRLLDFDNEARLLRFSRGPSVNNTDFIELELRLVNWQYVSSSITVSSSMTLSSLQRFIEEKHGRIEQLQFFRDPPTSSSELKDWNVPLSQLSLAVAAVLQADDHHAAPEERCDPTPDEKQHEDEEKHSDAAEKNADVVNVSVASESREFDSAPNLDVDSSSNSRTADKPSSEQSPAAAPVAPSSCAALPGRKSAILFYDFKPYDIGSSLLLREPDMQFSSGSLRFTTPI